MAYKNRAILLTTMIALSGCVSGITNKLPGGGDIKDAIRSYERGIKRAHSNISYAECLDKISLPKTEMESPENKKLYEMIPRFTSLVLESTEETLDGVLVEYPPFELYISEGRAVQSSLKTRLGEGERSYLAEDKDGQAMYAHRFGGNIRSGGRHYLSAAKPPLHNMSILARNISRVALQASYFGDELDYEAIYECSKIDGRYDKRFGGMKGLAFDEAKARVDFSSMTLEEREGGELSSLQKALLKAEKLEDNKRKYKALKKLF